MKYLKNYQSAWKGKPCEHVYAVLEERYDSVLRKCIRCFRIFEDRVNEY